jgi:hypothetical protein
MNLKPGDKYNVNTGRPNHVVAIEITKLNATEIEFMMRGEHVEEPDKPRVIGVNAFEEWLESSQFWKP